MMETCWFGGTKTITDEPGKIGNAMLGCCNSRVRRIIMLATGLLAVSVVGCSDEDPNASMSDTPVVDATDGDAMLDASDADSVTEEDLKIPKGPCPIVRSSLFAHPIGSQALWDIARAPQGTVFAAVADGVIAVGYLEDHGNVIQETPVDPNALGIGSVVAVAIAATPAAIVLAMATNNNPHIKVVMLGYDGVLINGGVVQTVAGLGESATSIRLVTPDDDHLGLVAVSGSAVPTAYGFVLGSADGKKITGPIVLGSSVVSGPAEALAAGSLISAVFYVATPSPKIVRSSFDITGKLVDAEAIVADQGGFGPIEPSFGALATASGITLALFAKTDGNPLQRGGYLVREPTPPIQIAPEALWTAAAVAGSGDDVFAAWRADGVLWGQQIRNDGDTLAEPVTLGGDGSKAGHLRAVSVGTQQYLVIWGGADGLHADAVDCSL